MFEMKNAEEFIFANLAHKVAVAHSKALDDMILGEIKHITTETGSKDLVVLNDTAIVAALTKAVATKPLCDIDTTYPLLTCSCCYDKLMHRQKYCSNCGQKIYWGEDDE
jgi:hypothetical protein